MTAYYYMGVMSGTSVDAIDAALVKFDDHTIRLIAYHSTPFEKTTKQLILDLFVSGPHEIQTLGRLDHSLGKAFATTCEQLLQKSSIPREHIRAIGCHGQTIRHQPFDQYPFTLQIGDPNIIAAHTGITTVADFRRRDIALGGQGAPLAPGFHAFLLNSYLDSCWILNIGGIANLTYKPVLSSEASSPSILNGFDTGPGNCLLDSWCFEHTQQAYDDRGQWAQQGQCHSQLLNQLLNDSYFTRLPPKSTGREYFNLNWLYQHLNHLNESIKAVDIQATLLELTARSIYLATQSIKTDTKNLYVCGGGYYNHALIQRLSELCVDLNIQSTEVLGILPQWVEASAFAWLAHQTLNNHPSNIPSVTGAKAATVLGAIYPGKNYLTLFN